MEVRIIYTGPDQQTSDGAGIRMPGLITALLKTRETNNELARAGQSGAEKVCGH